MENQSATTLQNYRNILAAFDGSPGSVRALRRALIVGREQKAQVTVFSVDEHVPRYAPGVGEIEEDERLRNQYFSKLKDQAFAIAAELKTSVKIETAVGHAAQSIIQMASEGNYDLVVLCRSGHSGLWGTLMGSTADRVVNQAPCDVLVVH